MDDNEIVFVCWSVNQLVRHADRNTIIIHAQHASGLRTLCGKGIRGAWDFEIGRKEGVTCKRCLKRLESYPAKERGTNA